MASCVCAVGDTPTSVMSFLLVELVYRKGLKENLTDYKNRS